MLIYFLIFQKLPCWNIPVTKFYVTEFCHLLYLLLFHYSESRVVALDPSSLNIWWRERSSAIGWDRRDAEWDRRLDWMLIQRQRNGLRALNAWACTHLNLCRNRPGSLSCCNLSRYFVLGYADILLLLLSFHITTFLSICQRLIVILIFYYYYYCSLISLLSDCKWWMSLLILLLHLPGLTSRMSIFCHSDLSCAISLLKPTFYHSTIIIIIIIINRYLYNQRHNSNLCNYNVETLKTETMGKIVPWLSKLAKAAQNNSVFNRDLNSLTDNLLSLSLSTVLRSANERIRLHVTIKSWNFRLTPPITTVHHAFYYPHIAFFAQHVHTT